MPWVFLHHALNFWIGGTLSPANANAEYFDWPGSPFQSQNLTGSWNHGSLLQLVTYSLGLLFGRHGFFGHNIPLFLLFPAVFVLPRARPREWPELTCAILWCAMTWALYSWASTNSSGQCCSIRWFVPLLAPCYYGFAVLLKYAPEYLGDLLVLSVWGAVLAGIAWWYGPWIKHMVPGYWLFQLGALTSWIIYRRQERWQVWFGQHRMLFRGAKQPV
jgi:hypothetical protein